MPRALPPGLRRLGAAVAVCVMLVAGCSPAEDSSPREVDPGISAAAPPIEQRPTTVGIADSDLLGLPRDQVVEAVERMKQLGVTTVRLLVPWAAIEYTKDRKQFGKSISDFQAVQFMLADMAMKVESARLMVYSAAARAERGEPNLGFISSAAKCFASDVAMEVTTDAVQLFGGAGYTVDFPVERYMRDAKITQIYEGTNQIQRVVMSRALLR